MAGLGQGNTYFLCLRYLHSIVRSIDNLLVGAGSPTDVIIHGWFMLEKHVSLK